MDSHWIKKTGSNQYMLGLIRNELKYDVQFASWAMSDKHDSSTQVNDDMEDWIDRTVKAGIANVKHVMSYALDEKTRMRTDEILEHPEEWMIALRFPKEWRGDAEVLCDLVHEYVVSYMKLQWNKFKFPQRVKDSMTDEGLALVKVHGEAYKCGPVSKTWTL